MANSDSDPDEGLTRDEIKGVEEPPLKRPKQDAFARLMAPKPKPAPPQPKPEISRGNPFKNRMALGAYIASPESYPPSVVVYHTEEFVVIHDKYPKATVHTLLLPRSAKHSLMHPLEAFEDREFLAKVQAEVVKLKALAATELQRRLGRFSRTDAAREAVLNGDAEPAGAAGAGDGGEGKAPELPPGRDWAAEIKCGIHAVPSMGHLHIHVLSRDMYSPSLKHRKHYNSFNTPFLVDIQDFPLGRADPRRHSKEEGFMRTDLKCWRCGQNFGNKFKQLKEHLDQEFEEWKKE